MKDRDTVMSKEQRNEVYDTGSFKTVGDERLAFFEAQAEISFKIGKTAGVAESLIPAIKAIEASRKEGIREVVEWLGKQSVQAGMEGCEQYRVWQLKESEWQAKLKEWGIGL